jgi:hypothetical protein
MMGLLSRMDQRAWLPQPAAVVVADNVAEQTGQQSPLIVVAVVVAVVEPWSRHLTSVV